MIRHPPSSSLVPYTTLFRSTRPNASATARHDCIKTYRIASVEAVRYRVLRITFDDGFSGAYDLTDLIAEGSMFAPLKDEDRKSTRLNSSHANISYAVFCLKK